MKLFELTKKCDRHIYFAIFIGLIAGIISAFVKSGFEELFPPRLSTTTPPPIVLLEKLGIHIDGMTYHWMDYTINWGGNGIHILFSVVVAIIYCVIVEYFPRAKMLHGIAFGLCVSIVAHGFLVPLFGLSHWLWVSGSEAIISEFVGTAFWMWTIEAIRQNLRQSFIK